MTRIDDIEAALNAMDVDLTPDAVDSVTPGPGKNTSIMHISLPTWRPITDILVSTLKATIPGCVDVTGDHSSNTLDVIYR